jgi:hypothetical protein
VNAVRDNGLGKMDVVDAQFACVALTRTGEKLTILQ